MYVCDRLIWATSNAHYTLKPSSRMQIARRANDVIYEGVFLLLSLMCKYWPMCHFLPTKDIAFSTKIYTHHIQRERFIWSGIFKSCQIQWLNFVCVRFFFVMLIEKESASKMVLSAQCVALIQTEIFVRKTQPLCVRLEGHNGCRVLDQCRILRLNFEENHFQPGC